MSAHLIVHARLLFAEPGEPTLSVGLGLGLGPEVERLSLDRRHDL